MPTETLPLASRFLIYDTAGSRSEQQDSAVCFANPKSKGALLIVCDGVGGSSDGGLASHIATEQAERYWKEKGEALANPKEDLAQIVRQAHDHIQKEGERQHISPRTTFVGLYVHPKGANWAHCGDSRLYHFRGAQLVSRTRDHSVVEILVKQGQVPEEEMGTHPDQGRLLQSLGGPEYKPPTVAETEMTPDDAFLLCTDGFWERTTPVEMAKILYAPRDEVEGLLQRAVQRAAQRNGKKSDNITVAIALPERAAKKKGPASMGSALPYLLAIFLILISLVCYYILLAKPF